MGLPVASGIGNLMRGQSCPDLFGHLGLSFDDNARMAENQP
jgi:hypothetical protein